MKKQNSKLFAKVLGVICVLTLLVSALYVPMSFSANAAAIPVEDNKTVTFNFDGTDAANCTSWALHTFDASNGVRGVGWLHGNSVAWGTGGGYRLNNADGEYKLETNSTYIVSFKLNVLAAPIKTAAIAENATSYLKLGYGFAAGGDGNPIGTMKTTVSDVFTADRVPQEDKENGTFKLTTAAGVKQHTVGRDTYELTYVFTTPDEFAAGADNNLGFFAVTHYGLEFVVDDVQVTKLSASKGAVILVDEYYGTTEVVTGELDSAVELPALEGTDPTHEFKGWFVDADRTTQAENVTFKKDIQTLYTFWKAPVTVTFVDTHNNIIIPVTGVAGETIVYPEEPVDLINSPAANWFMGWYTTESYTEAFTATTFGYSSYDVFAKWLSEIPDQVQSFENYNTGVSEWAYGKMMSIVADPTGNNRGKVNKYNWDVNTNKYDTNKYGTIDSTAVMHGIMLEEKRVYDVTFDYYVEDLPENVTFTVFPVNGAATNIWQGARVDFKATQGAKFDITSADKDGAWHEGKFSFTMKYGQPDNTAVHFVMILSEKCNATVYIDNVVFKTTQPYESTITYVHNDGRPDITVKGNRGDSIENYTPEGEYPFGGWYSDSACTVKFNGKTFGREPITVYAKWAGKVVSFKDFRANYYTKWSLSFKNEAGVGYDDDYALSLDYEGSKINPDMKQPFYVRTTANDYCLALIALPDKSIYTIKYYVKVNYADADFEIMLGMAHDGNIWEGSAPFTETKTVISKEEAGKGWFSKEFTVTADYVNTHFDDLYLFFNVLNPNAQTKVDALVDRIEIVEATGAYAAFDTGIIGDTLKYQFGEEGDEIKFPELRNGGLQFLGWYTDAAHTNKVTATKLVSGYQRFYAKWEGYAETFENFKLDSKQILEQGKLVNVVKGEGVGYDDNAKLSFYGNGGAVKEEKPDGTVEYWGGKITSYRDNCVRINDKLKNHTAYRIGYYYKSAPDANVDTLIQFALSRSGSIWEPSSYVNLFHTKNVAAAKETQWQYAETVIYTDFLDVKEGNTLYMQFGALKGGKEYIAGVDIDNVLIIELEAPYIHYDGLNSAYSQVIQGTVGGEIKGPASVPVRVGYNFTGWFADKECTIPFTKKIFEEGDRLAAFAGYEKSNKVLYTLENFQFSNPQGWFLWDIANGWGEFDFAYSGTHAFFFDRDPDKCGNKWEGICVGDGNEIFKLDATRQYVVTFKYYVEKQGSGDAKVSFWAGHSHNRYHKNAKLTDDYIVNIMEDVGVWKTGALVINPKNIVEESEYLFLIVDGGQDFMLYFDDIEITTLPEGHTGYVIDNGGCDAVPMYVTGKIGSSFANQLPSNPKYDNHKFQGYKYFDANNNSDMLTPDKMVFSEEKLRIVANFVRLKTVMDFEKGYKELLESHGDYSAADYDYELYDANKEGNSKDNVTSGRYALHRKGTSMYFENAQLVTQDKMLSNTERYTLTMKVKLGKYFQTDGAVKIASCKNPYYAWTTTGDYHAIVAIKDLLDGEWHEITYTFNSVEAFLAIQTPGYCELFIDDVVITWVEKDTPLSSSVDYTEYVPAKRDANGNLVDLPAVVIDVDSIIDESLLNKTNGAFNMLYVIIGGAALVVIAAAVILVIVLKKRKAKKA